MIRQLLFSCYQRELYRDLESSRDAQLAAIAAKAVKEVAYHVEHASTWVLRLGDGTELSHDRTQAALERSGRTATRCSPTTSWPAGSPTSASARCRRLRPAWLGSVQDILTEATLSLPDDDWKPSGGRHGLHTEGFGYLLAEMQHLHRSHPGARW